MTAPDRFTSRAVDLGQLAEAARARQADEAGVAAYIEITADNAENEMIRRSVQVPVVVLVGTPRSAESEQLRADLRGIAEEGEKTTVVVAYLDADAQPQLAQALGVQGLPTVLALAAGRPVASFQGGQPVDQLRGWVGALVEQVGGQLEGLPDAGAGDGESPADPRLARAGELLAAGEHAAAVAAYEEILAAEPDNREARQALDNARLLKRLADSEEKDPVAAADAEPDNLDKQFAAADALIAAGDAEAAFDRLTGLMQGAAQERKNAVRDRLVELFALFSAGDPRVAAARTRMASALF